jgi:uncharacterized protein
MTYRLSLVLAGAGLIIAVPRIYAGEGMRGPVPAQGHAEETYGNGGASFLGFYQQWLSPAKGGNTCPMHPACSQYARIVFRRYSPLEACVRTCERLLRCGRMPAGSRLVRVGGVLRFYDPVPGTLQVARRVVP